MLLPAAAVAARLREAFEAECRELGLKARLEVASDLRVAPTFDGQFGAEPAWLAATFFEELRSRGVNSASSWLPVPLPEADVAAIGDALRGALRRTRARLVDSDSWNSGGHPWPFEAGDPALTRRGVALYRAPARAAAAIDCGPGHGASISIPAGDCGEVVSAGVWIPTWLEGDFVADVRYGLPVWQSGEREACLGVFAVAADGTFRIYAQRVSRAGAADRVVADLNGTPGPAASCPASRQGTLRIARDRGLLSAWHRARDQWTWLGRIREEADRALIVGAKIWALGVCGPLRADLVDFALAGAAAREQGEVPPTRPDPRHSA